MSPARGGGRPGRREPPEFRRGGGDYRGGLSKAENTRDPKDRKPPSRPRGRGRGGGLGGPSGRAVLVGMGFMMAIEGTAARAPPGRGNHRGGPSRPPAPREPVSRRGGGGQGEQVRRGDAAAPGHGRGGEREVGDRSRGGRGSRVGSPAGPGAGVRGLARAQVGRVGGRAEASGEAERGRRHNQGSAPHPAPPVDFPRGSPAPAPRWRPLRGPRPVNDNCCTKTAPLARVYVAR
jgi:hypothetical protein